MLVRLFATECRAPKTDMPPGTEWIYERSSIGVEMIRRLSSLIFPLDGWEEAREVRTPRRAGSHFARVTTGLLGFAASDAGSPNH